MAMAKRWADQYLGLPGTELETKLEFVVRTFVLYRLFKDLLIEHRAPAFTIKSCMGTIIPMASTTACLALSLLNDEGWMAFCESDFVIIPPGVLLRYLSGRPVFLHNSTFPHQGMVTCAHCTAPRRMDGVNLEPVRLVTHFESDHGAATHVHFPKGQTVTVIKPDFEAKHWLALTGKTTGHPMLATCRAQIEVALDAQTQDVLRNMRGFHCQLAYGDWTREVRYAAKKVGIEVQRLPKAV